MIELRRPWVPRPRSWPTTDVDAGSVKLAGFQVPSVNPVTKEMLAEFIRTHERTRYRMGPDGKLINVET
jgi:hypothetical protein